MPISTRAVSLTLFLLTFTFTFALTQDAPPPGARMMRFSAEDAVMLREIMTLVGSEKGKMTVMMVPPADRRPQGMPEVELQSGDEVGMANGKRITSIKELRKAYDETKPGDEFKMGVRRDGRPLIVTFTRKDEKDMPGGGQQMVMRSGPSDPNSEIFPALGFELTKKADGVVVNETLPHVNKGITKGDVIVSLNGKTIGTTADFSKELDATRVGDKLTIVLKRGTQNHTVSFPRPEPRGMIRMTR